jgi:Lrp/AsnC family transcriptional regulator
VQHVTKRPLDPIDRKILNLLQSHPEMPLAQISERVSLSQTPCWRRVKRLETDGVIRGRAVLLDPTALGLGVSVFASLKLRQHDELTLQKLELAASERPEIVECYCTSGEIDYVLRVVTKSIEAYEQFLKKVLLHFPGIASVGSSFTLKCVKSTTLLPIDSTE